MLFLKQSLKSRGQKKNQFSFIERKMFLKQRKKILTFQNPLFVFAFFNRYLKTLNKVYGKNNYDFKKQLRFLKKNMHSF